MQLIRWFCSYYYLCSVILSARGWCNSLPRCFLPLYYVMWDFYIHLYLYVFHFHIYIYPILGNVMFPHFIFVGAVYNHTISTYYVSPHISTISIFILSIQNILCGDTNKSSPTLNHHPNLYISRPLDPQFTRGPNFSCSGVHPCSDVLSGMNSFCPVSFIVHTSIPASVWALGVGFQVVLLFPTVLPRQFHY